MILAGLASRTKATVGIKLWEIAGDRSKRVKTPEFDLFGASTSPWESLPVSLTVTDLFISIHPLGVMAQGDGEQSFLSQGGLITVPPLESNVRPPV